MKILVFGSLNKDFVYSVDHIVKPGETISSYDYGVFWGGKGLNQSIALRKAGAPVSFACKVSNEDAVAVKELFKANGLPTQYLSSGGSCTGHAIIQIDNTGQNSILLHSGANHEISEAWIDEVLSAFGMGDYLLLQNEINNIGYIINAAKNRGVKIILNPSPFEEELLNLPLNLIDIFILNEIEGGELSGTCDMNAMPGALLKKFPNAAIVLTLGEKGAVYISNNERITQNAYKVTAVDTTAAGDAFTGFFISEYTQGKSISQALDTAAKAAAMAVMVKGAANSVPELSQVQASCLV